MKDHRQGNDLAVLWSILKDGEPFDLRGRSLKLYLKNLHERKEVEDFSVTGNEIHWTFYGKDQDTLGKHSLILVANEDEKGMITTDVCDFVRLVSCSCKLQGGEDAPNVETESIELTSTLEYVAGGMSEEEVLNLLDGKVDKVEGLGLSEENYTADEKEKLAGLENYDDSGIKDELAKKAEKSEIPTKMSQLEQDIEIGSDYDDTEIREELLRLGNNKADKSELTELSAEVSGLSEGITLRNVGAEDTDESVEEPEIPTPTPSNEWKCVFDGRMAVGIRDLEFTTYADGTPLQAKEMIIQILMDKSAAKSLQGYVQVQSTTNKNMVYYGAIHFEAPLSNGVPLMSQCKIAASPYTYMVAEIIDKMPLAVAQGTVAWGRAGSDNAAQIYEDFVFVRIGPSNPTTEAAPYLKVYAR